MLVLEQELPHGLDRFEIRIEDGPMVRWLREYSREGMSSFELDDWVYLAAPDHPVFDHMENDDFFRWNGDGILVSTYLQHGDAEVAKGSAPIKRRKSKLHPGVIQLAACYRYLMNTAVSEIPVGNGRLLLSQLRACRRIGDDPLATRYIRNLLHYVGNPAYSP